MSSPPLPAQSSPAGAIALAVAGCIPYGLLIVSLVYGPPGGDPSQYGPEDRLDQSLAQLYAILFGVLLWIVIGILLRSAVRTGVPRWAAIATGILFPISAIAAFVAGAASFDLPGGWSILVPALLPPLIALWAIWLRSPRLRALVTVERASIAGLATVAIVCAATIPLNILDRLQMPARAAADARKNEAIAAQLAAERARRERAQRGKFASLTPESPFADYLDYLNANLPEPEHEKAVAQARRSATRQEAAVTLLQEEKAPLFEMRELWRLDVAATPELCSALNGALIKRANWDELNQLVGAYLEDQLPNMKFFTAAGCKLDAALDAAMARVQKIIGPMGKADPDRERWNAFIAAVSALRQVH